MFGAPGCGGRGLNRRLFRQADLQRAIRGVLALGLEVQAVEVGLDGAIRVLTRKPAPGVAVNDDEDWVSHAGKVGKSAARG